MLAQPAVDLLTEGRFAAEPKSTILVTPGATGGIGRAICDGD